MGCLDFHPDTKFFKIARPPKKTTKAERDWTLFIKCVKTLGAYSVSLSNRGERAPVDVECGNLPDEIVFRVPECDYTCNEALEVQIETEILDAIAGMGAQISGRSQVNGQYIRLMIDAKRKSISIGHGSDERCFQIDKKDGTLTFDSKKVAEYAIKYANQIKARLERSGL